MGHLDEAKWNRLLEWLDEADDEKDPDDDETQDQANTRASQARKIAAGEIERGEDLGKAKKGGHKRINPFDMSGSTPEEPVLKGMSPKLAGERAKAIMVLGRVKGFIEKYSNLAIDKFGGMSAPDEKSIEYRGSSGVRGDLGVRKSAKTVTGKDDIGRVDKSGNVKGMSQMMSKDKVFQIIDKLPMMPSSQMMFAVRTIGNYIWRIHATARDDIRKSVKYRLKGGGQVPFRKSFNPETGEESDTKSLDTDSDHYKDSLKAASREFDQDSVQIKGDLNMLAKVAGFLKSSGGFGGAADKTFLDKIIKGYVDKEGNFHMKSVEITPKPSDVALPPELDALSHKVEPEDEPEEKPKSSSKDKGFVLRKKGDKKESIDVFMNRVIEIAAADRAPKWWDEL